MHKHSRLYVAPFSTASAGSAAFDVDALEASLAESLADITTNADSTSYLESSYVPAVVYARVSAVMRAGRPG